MPCAPSSAWKSSRSAGRFRTARGETLSLEAERREEPGDLADVPFDRVQAEAPLVMCVTPRFLPPGQQVLDAHRDQRAERDLERPAAEVEVAGAARRAGWRSMR